MDIKALVARVKRLFKANVYWKEEPGDPYMAYIRSVIRADELRAEEDLRFDSRTKNA